jgi:uncharacterized protein (TIGR03435 family)
MPTRLNLFLLISISLLGAEPSWKEFSLGPMTQKGPVNPRGTIRDGSLRAKSISARTLIAISMGISPARVLGPDWIDSERYKISAVLSDADARSLRTRSSGGASRNEQFQALLRQEIIRRFGMEFQPERRVTSGFAAGLPPSGSVRARRSKSLEGARFKESGTPVINVRRTLDVRGATMPEFLEWLERSWLRAPVVATGAAPQGVWDFRIRWTTADHASLFRVVKEEVGIEITPGTVSPEYLIIKRIERPEIGHHWPRARPLHFEKNDKSRLRPESGTGRAAVPVGGRSGGSRSQTPFSASYSRHACANPTFAAKANMKQNRGAA